MLRRQGRSWQPAPAPASLQRGRHSMLSASVGIAPRFCYAFKNASSQRRQGSLFLLTWRRHASVDRVPAEGSRPRGHARKGETPLGGRVRVCLEAAVQVRDLYSSTASTALLVVAVRWLLQRCANIGSRTATGHTLYLPGGKKTVPSLRWKYTATFGPETSPTTVDEQFTGLQHSVKGPVMPVRHAAELGQQAPAASDQPTARLEARGSSIKLET